VGRRRWTYGPAAGAAKSQTRWLGKSEPTDGAAGVGDSESWQKVLQLVEKTAEFLGFWFRTFSPYPLNLRKLCKILTFF
jgi:hypothetical protein